MNKVLSGLLIGVVASWIIVLVLAYGPIPVSTSAPVQAQASVVAPAAAVFQVDKLTINPARVSPGQEVMITTTVRNNGGTEGQYIADLGINNTLEEQQQLALPAGAAKTLGFSTYRYEAGTYTVNLGGQIGQFEVLAQDVPAQSAAAGSGGASCCGGGGASTPSTATQAGCCGGGAAITPTTPGTSFKPATQKKGGCCG